MYSKRGEDYDDFSGPAPSVGSGHRVVNQRRRSSFIQKCTVSGCQALRFKLGYCAIHLENPNAPVAGGRGGANSSGRGLPVPRRRSFSRSSSSRSSSSRSRSRSKSRSRSRTPPNRGTLTRPISSMSRPPTAVALPEGNEVEFEIPRNTEAFLRVRTKVGMNGEGAATLVLAAFLTLEHDEEKGLQFLAMMTDKSDMTRESGPTAYHGYALVENDADRWLNAIGKQRYLARSYVSGATPENDYETRGAVQTAWIGVTARARDGDDDQIQVWFLSSGAQYPRSVKLEKDRDGMYKIKHFVNLLMPVKKP